MLHHQSCAVVAGSLIAGGTLVSAYVANRVRPLHKVVTGVRGIGAAALSLVTPTTWRAALYAAASVGLLGEQARNYAWQESEAAT